MNKIDFFIDMMTELGYTETKEIEIDQKLYPKSEWASYQVVRGSGLIEDVCIHDVGHPNAEWLKLHDPDGLKGFRTHGCCGCCKNNVVDKL